MIRSCLLAAALAASVAEAATATITVHGTCSLPSAPDMCIVTMGVNSYSLDVKDAFTDCNGKMEALFKALSDFGVPNSQIASQLSCQAHNEYNGTVWLRKGFDVSNLVTVAVTDLTKLSQILGAAIDAGVNTIQSLDYQLKDASKEVNAVKAGAMKNAIEKAKLMLAQMPCHELGAIVTATESSYGHYPQPAYRLADAMGSDVPVSGGTKLLTADCDVTFEIIVR